MQLLLSCAKTMASESTIQTPLPSKPMYEKEAGELALQLMQYPVSELQEILHVNTKIAAENKLRYQRFHGDGTSTLPALLAYTGIVFQRLNPRTFSSEDFLYAQQHLFITSFLYGLLRPLDSIKSYRLEGNLMLPEHHGQTVFDYWKPILTQQLIAQVKADDGILVNLASDEMKGLFNWKEVEKELHILTPEFKVWKGDRLRTIVIYTKMCRGEMTRFILKNRITQPKELKAFEWEGFKLEAKQHTESDLLFTL